MTLVSNRNLFSDVAAGAFPGWKIVDKYGYNLDIDSASNEDVWSVGGLYPWPNAAEQLKVSSSSSNDTNSSGTGARKIIMEGVDGNFDFLEETVNLNGSTEVTTTGSFRRIFRAYVDDAGSLEGNDGTISILSNDSLTTLAEIPLRSGANPPGRGQTQMAIYTVPRNYQLQVYGVQMGVDDGQPSEIYLCARTNLDTNPCFRVAATYFEIQSQIPLYGFGAPKTVTGPADVFIRVDAGSNNTRVTAQFYGIVRPI